MLAACISQGKTKCYPVEPGRGLFCGQWFFLTLRRIALYIFQLMTSQRRQNKTFTHIGGILSGALASYRRQPDNEMARVWELWDRTVGAAIAENTRPAAFRGGHLVVNVSSSIWAQQLQFLKADLIAKVNRALGKPLVTDIRFKVGPL